MIWRWLINGLAGLVSMMLAFQSEGTKPEPNDHAKLTELIEQLGQIRDGTKP